MTPGDPNTLGDRLSRLEGIFEERTSAILEKIDSTSDLAAERLAEHRIRHDTLADKVEAQGRRFGARLDEVEKALGDMQDVVQAVADMKDSAKWAFRLVAGAVLTFVTLGILAVVQAAP